MLFIETASHSLKIFQVGQQPSTIPMAVRLLAFQTGSHHSGESSTVQYLYDISIGSLYKQGND